MIQLTHILKDFIYNVNEVEFLTIPKKISKISTTTPRYFYFLFFFSNKKIRDPKLDSIDWNEDRITQIWFIMLGYLINILKKLLIIYRCIRKFK